MLAGAYLGEDDACSQALVRRVVTHLKPLRKAIGLHDVGKTTTSLQVQLSILRVCANTQLTYFLRTMPPSVTIDAARKHDEIIEETWHAMLRTASAYKEYDGKIREYTRRGEECFQFHPTGLTPRE